MAGQPRRKPAKHDAIADDLRTKIYSREIGPGDRVPSENEIKDQYKVSADTARKALAELAHEGLTEVSQGSPTVVRGYRPIRRKANERLSAAVWAEGRSMWDIDAPDRERTVEDLTVTEVEAPELVAASLDLEEGDRVLRRSRRYCVDGERVMRAVSYLPADLVAGTPIAESNPGQGGIYARLVELGHKPVHFREEIRVRMPTRAEADDLQLGPGTPVAVIARYAADEDGRVVEVNEMTLNSAKYVLEYAFSS